MPLAPLANPFLPFLAFPVAEVLPVGAYKNKKELK